MRPNPGTLGKPITIETNLFPFTKIPNQCLFEYEIVFNPECSTSTSRKVIIELSRQHGFLLFYDGKRKGYTQSDLKLVSLNVTLDGKNGFTIKEFNVNLKKMGCIDLNMAKEYITKGCDTDQLESVLNAMDVVIKHQSNLSLIGRNLFTQETRFNITQGVEIWQGYHQSLRPTQSHLLMNIDVATGAFYEPGSVVHTVCRVLNMGIVHYDTFQRILTDKEWILIERFLKDVFVIAQYRGDYKRKWKDQLPCLVVGDINKGIYIPMELCFILSGQKYPFRLNEEQTRQMIRLTCQTPNVRKSNIHQGRQLVVNDKELLENCGISIAAAPLRVPARILPSPKVAYNSSNSVVYSPVDGVWPLVSKKLSSTTTLQSWCLIVFASKSSISLEVVDRFLDQFRSACKSSGIPITCKPVIQYSYIQDAEVTLKKVSVESKQNTGLHPQIALCILPNSNSQLYTRIKYIGDTQLGIPTQCILAKSNFIIRVHPKSLKIIIIDVYGSKHLPSIILKVNVKLGGTNFALDSYKTPFTQVPTMILGADITHPSPGDLNKPSIAALVGSMDSNHCRYMSTTRAQVARLEILYDLKDMFLELLRAYKKCNGNYPERILFYRDGVPVGKYKDIAIKEVAALQGACKELNCKSMQITCVIVQKRHHVKFFGLDKNDMDKSGNVSSGTVVDTHVIDSKDFDFFLISHAGLQGTSKPRHYYVLHDDYGFTSNEIQTLTLNLCFLYCRSARAVSIVPPVYYAHLAASRSRFHQMLSENEYKNVVSELQNVMYFM